MNDLVYIEPTRSNMNLYKRLIKKQGEQICRNEIELYTITKAMDEFNFGFIHISQKARVGHRMLDVTDRIQLNGFVFCRYIEEFNDVSVDLVCSRKHMHLGREFMEAVEEKAKELNAGRLVLCSLGEERLKRWYEAIGFRTIGEIPYHKGGIKVYTMMKILHY